MIDIETVQRGVDANIAKLSQIAQDAHDKRKELESESGVFARAQGTYYLGFEDGIKRAIRVLQGKG